MNRSSKEHAIQHIACRLMHCDAQESEQWTKPEEPVVPLHQSRESLRLFAATKKER